MTTRRLTALLIIVAFGLAACSTVSAPSSAHLHAEEAKTVVPAEAIPVPVQTSVSLPRPRAITKAETYSVVVNNTKAQELLFALARDAKLNVDIHPGITGTVTLNAIDQTLPQLLQRISKQVDMRWELDGQNLAVMPDTPFLRSYKVDYVNLARDASGSIAASSQITSGTGGATGGGAAGNTSTSKVDNVFKNHFWASLEKNIKDLLRETDKVLPEGSSETVVEHSDQQATTGTGAQNTNARNTRSTAQQQQTIAGSPNPAALQQEGTTVVRRATFREAASVIVNAETGVISVRATARQHEKIQEFIDQVSTSARRQVMIEATIVEVELNDTYRQGISWDRFRDRANKAGGFSVSPQTTPSGFTLTNKVSSPLDLNLTLSLLEQFGNVKVLSSPRLSVLNNQSAILKVVESFIYFLVKSDIVPATTTAAAYSVVTTTPQSVSVGLVMSVTPQISENNSITLNIRPSISSISGTVADPNPDLKTANITNYVPNVRSREIESVMRVEDGEIAVLGGLMQEKADYTTGRVPGIGAIPFIGELFTRRDNVVSKSELVIFLRPVVIRDPSLAGDYKKQSEFLPGSKFLAPPPSALPFGLNSTGGTAQ